MKLAIVSGASAGIGLTLVDRFLARDYIVVNLSRRLCPHSGVKSIQCDLSNPAFFDDIRDTLIPLAMKADHVHLIHNAARYLNDSAVDTPDEDLVSVLQTNVVAPNTLNRELLPFMKAGSSIVLVGSTLSEKAVAGCFTYVTSKHAQVGLMRALCQDLAGTRVHTVMICPGFTDTEMLRSHVPAEAMPAVAKQSTFGRLISPEEIADAILMATEMAVLNGSVIHANLGQVES